MTWTANARVTEINETSEGWSVIAEAQAGREVEATAVGYGGLPAQELYSNTEGEIKKIAIEFVVDRRPAFNVGDRISAHGHFDALKVDTST